MGVVALLAQRREVQQARRFWPVVEHMRRGQNHFPARYRMRLSVLRAAPLAAVLRPVKAHKPASQLPVFRVSGSVLRSNRHSISNFSVEATAKAAPHFGRYAPSFVSDSMRHPIRPTSSSTKIRAVSVSYTHLDVYKRQVGA